MHGLGLCVEDAVESSEVVVVLVVDLVVVEVMVVVVLRVVVVEVMVVVVLRVVVVVGTPQFSSLSSQIGRFPQSTLSGQSHWLSDIRYISWIEFSSQGENTSQYLYFVFTSQSLKP